MTSPAAPLLALEATQPRAMRLLGLALQHGRLPHGILMVGPPSTPVAALCRALAGLLLCRSPKATPPASLNDACGACAGCVMHHADTHPNAWVLRGNERGTINVAQIRAATAKLHLRPQMAEGPGSLNVLVIEGAHGMQKGAQNALLKTLEEPPGTGCIIMGTPSVGLMLPTILSRVVRVVLAPPHRDVGSRALLRAGIDSPYAELLAPQVGCDTALGQSLMDAGFVEVENVVRQALTFGLPVQESLALATTLSQNPAHFDMALALLEVLLRDALAILGGAAEGQVTQPGVANVLTQLPAARVSLGIDRLLLLRRQRKLNINRAQALEGLFVTLNHRGTLP